jgi:hypothetical protein
MNLAELPWLAVIPSMNDGLTKAQTSPPAVNDGLEARIAPVHA